MRGIQCQTAPAALSAGLHRGSICAYIDDVARTARTFSSAPQAFEVEICVLAGGRSSRLGRDKARLRLGRRTVLGYIRATARELDLPIRVIRNDLVPPCGPLSGVYTALHTTRAGLVLFLACDMPFVPAQLLRNMLTTFRVGDSALFVRQARAVGFPFLLRRTALATVRQQLDRKQYSLQSLAGNLKARVLRPPHKYAVDLLNINTPADWQAAQKRAGNR